MSTPINTDITIDYFSVIHRNLYRMRIDPKQRCIIKKCLRLINDLDENPGNPPLFWPYQHDPKPTYASKCQSGGRANQTPSSWPPWQRSFTDSHQQRKGPTNLPNYKEFRASRVQLRFAAYLQHDASDFTHMQHHYTSASSHRGKQPQAKISRTSHIKSTLMTHVCIFCLSPEPLMAVPNGLDFPFWRRSHWL